MKRIIIIAAVVLIGSGVLAWQHLKTAEKTATQDTITQRDTAGFEASEKTAMPDKKTAETDFSSPNKDVLLGKLFPNLTFNNGIADHTAEHYKFLDLHLQDFVEDYFINTQEKDLLLIVKLDGVAHAGGLYHAFLGLFDESGNLLTPASLYPSTNFDFSDDKTHFGGDKGDFKFYDCKGIKYIAFASAGCPNGSCCFGSAKVYRISNGSFEEVQTINDDVLENGNPSSRTIISPAYAASGPSYGLSMTLSDEKIIIAKVPAIADERNCQESSYKVLNWNKGNCRFE